MCIEGQDIANNAIRHIQETRALEYQWLFILAGFLKGSYMKEQSPGEFGDLLVYFAKKARESLRPGDYLDWRDMESVKLEFEKVWATRKYVLKSDSFESFIYLSEGNNLPLDPSMNYWIRRVIETAFLLQESQPDLPFLLPINPRIADLFQTTQRTLALALNNAIELDYIRVVEEATTTGPRRTARRLRFNFEHPGLASHGAREVAR